MKRTIIVFALVVVFALSAVSSAFATTQSYSIIVPRLGFDKYSGPKTVSAKRDFGVKHKFSGSRTVYFTVCNTSRQAIGPKVAIFPGGSTAPLFDLWYNDSTSIKTILVRLESSTYCAVDLLAEGTWVWDY